MTKSNTDIKHTLEGLALFDYTNSNPNGDFNAGGAPHIDPVDGRCYVSGESLRRKMRDYVMAKHEGKPPFGILIRGAGHLEREDGRSLTIDDGVQEDRKAAGMGVSPDYEKERETRKRPKKRQKPELDEEKSRRLRETVLARRWDVRCFGFLGGVGNSPIGGVKGALTIEDGVSLHPVIDLHQTNTRKIVTRESEPRDQTVGNRTVLRYALVAHKFAVTPATAHASRMMMSDFKLALEAMINCWTMDMSPHRRGVFRGIWLFKQPRLGRRPAAGDWDQVARVSCKLDEPLYASSFSDFTTVVDTSLLPPGVEIIDTDGVLDLINFYGEDEAAA